MRIIIDPVFLMEKNAQAVGLDTLNYMLREINGDPAEVAERLTRTHSTTWTSKKVIEFRKAVHGLKQYYVDRSSIKI